MGELTKLLESHFKNPVPKLERLNGVLLALLVLLTFALPVYFGLRFIYISLGFFVYILVAAVILKLTICTKLETDWGIAPAKAIKSGGTDISQKVRSFLALRRDRFNWSTNSLISYQINSRKPDGFQTIPNLLLRLFWRSRRSRVSSYQHA